MANKLTLVLSSKDTAFNHSVIAFILCDYFNRYEGTPDRYEISQSSRKIDIKDTFEKDKVIFSDSFWPQIHFHSKDFGVKIYDRIEPIRQICMTMFGFEESQCYDSFAAHDNNTNIGWEDVPQTIREKHKKPRKGSGGIKDPTGIMSSAEVINVLSNDVIGKMDRNALSRGVYTIIKKDAFPLAILINTAAPNEITMGAEIGAKTIRFVQNNNKKEEDPMADLPLGEYSLVVHDNPMLPERAWGKISGKIKQWMNEANL